LMTSIEINIDNQKPIGANPRPSIANPANIVENKGAIPN